MMEEVISRRVLARLRNVGWQQNAPGNYKGPNCMIGAAWWELGGVLPDYHADDPIIQFALGECERRWLGIAQAEFGAAIAGVISFNDAPHRTFEDVALVLEKAAALEEEMGL